MVTTNYNLNNIKAKNVKSTYNISENTLYNWNKKIKNNESLEVKRKSSKYTPIIKLFIRNYVLKRINFNYILLIKRIKVKFNVDICKSSIYSILKQMNISKVKIKKKSHFIKRLRYEKLKKQLKKDFKKHKNKMVFIDEVSIDTHIYPDYGWTVKGKSINMRHKKYRKRVTLICAINNDKIVHYKYIKDTSNAETFKQFLDELKHKTNIKNYLLDNARIHHSKIVKKYAKDNSINLIFNVPYSPEFNPIERVFSELKRFLKTRRDNMRLDSLLCNVKKCFKNISSKNINNYIQKSYSLLFKK